jgi:hypothetical protein
MSVRTAVRIPGPIPLLVSAVLTVVLARGCSNGATSCSADKDCPSKSLSVCIAGTCTECRTDSECKDSPHGGQCDRMANVCIPFCTANHDCKNPAYPLCGLPDTGDCVACVKDSDCKTANTYCGGFECLPQCKSDSDCMNNPDDKYCDTNHTCTASCAMNCADRIANGQDFCLSAGAPSMQAYSMLVACVASMCAFECPNGGALDTDAACVMCRQTSCGLEQETCSKN